MLFLLKLVLLLLVGISHKVHSTCVQHQYCDDNDETLAAIASDPQNVQQLEKLFYPVNGAHLASFAIIVYFLNYTGPLPQQCAAGSYPWASYPTINTTYQEMEWYLWTTEFSHTIAPPLKILELGMYLPAVTSLFLFNRTFPLVQPTPTACLAVPYSRNASSMEMVTTELFSIVSPEKYKEQLWNLKNQGVYSVCYVSGIPPVDLRTNTHLHQLGHRWIDLHHAFNGIQWTCSLGALLVVYHYAESWLQWLRTAIQKHRGWLAVFWATVNVCFVLNIYTILKMTASTCFNATVRECSYGAIAIFGGVALSAIPVVIRFCDSKHHLPPPRMWQLCFPWNCFTLSRIYFLLSSWIVCFTLIVTPGVHIPYAILLLSTNYLLYSTVLVAIYLLLPTAICLTALIYTMDQMFCINMEFRLTCRIGIQQVYRLLVAAVAFFGTAGFAVSLHFLLLLSKNGDKTQSISTTVFILLFKVSKFHILAYWAIWAVVRKLWQVMNHEWETVQIQPSTNSLSV